MAVKACLLQHTKDPYREKIREAIWNRVEPNSSGVRETSQGMAHFLREWYHDVTDTKTVEVLEEIFNKTFIHHRMLGTGETSRRNERVHALHKIYAEFRFDGTRYRGDWNIYTYGAMKYLTSLKNHLTMNPKNFDRQHEKEIEFIDETTSLRGMNEDSVIRTVIQEHRAVLGLANPAEKISEWKEDKERYYRLILRYFVFFGRELERKAEMKLSGEKMKNGRDERLRFWVRA